MKVKILLLSILLLSTIFGCNEQKKPKKIQSKNKTTELSITDNFNKVKKLYFDFYEKIIFSNKLIEGKGEFTIYYIPILKQSIHYYKHFEESNNIKPLYDELNSLYYYSPEDQKKIDDILRQKVKSEKEFVIIGTFISKENINIETNEEYSINFPYIQKYYKKENEKWIFLTEKEIKNSEDDEIFNSKEYFQDVDLKL